MPSDSRKYLVGLVGPDVLEAAEKDLFHPVRLDLDNCDAIEIRYDFFDRNGLGATGTGGFLNAPAIGLNYFIPSCNLKLSGMYEFVGRWGHARQLDRDIDDLGIATHKAVVMLQYSF